ncbi:MAG: hypothetical protein A2W25_08565 [candidate division Zixibacteria bacterium RBG_16_53_22]|nr:MAG: hypothetical protein A2W25_08565 [candidate division Zixibacteria bacterium RBG_16_53_22]
MTNNDEKYYDPSEHEPMPEGEEKPPPLTRTMAAVRWTILAGMTIFALVMIVNALGLAPWDAHASDNVQYHCPMHPTYIASQPGDCPICGMSLVPINSEGKEVAGSESGPQDPVDRKPDKIPEAEKSDISKKGEKLSTEQYVCPMHPEVKSDKPGDCPKCGMDLVKAAKAEKVSAETTYVCPMHPEVTSDKPGECPKCGMDLTVASGTREASSDSATAVYTCPMHPDVISDKPGECPKCGMDLVPASKTDNEQEIDTVKSKPAGTSAKYYCPMHPEVTSDEPGRCPKCKMFLEPVKQESDGKPDPTPPAGHEGHSGMQMENNEQALARHPSGGSVPGLVPVTIEPNRLQLIGVKTASVERRRLDSQTSIVGYVTPDENKMKNINARVSGWVVDLFVNETGQYVEAGQPLMSLYSQDLYQAEQDFLSARDALKDGSTDQALTSMRQQIYDAARVRLKLLGLSNDQIDELAKSDFASSQMMIKSPVSGYVLTKNILPGQYFTPDQNLFTVADLSDIWVIGDVYEQDISSVTAGMPVTMTLTAFPGERFSGKVDFIYPSVSSQTRAMKVRAQFPNKGMKIRPGMYAEIEIERGADNVLAIPQDAVMDNGDIQYAFIVHDRAHFVPTRLELGHETGDWVEVLSGVKGGDVVVTSANFLIDSESRLKAAIAGMTGTSQQSAEPGTGTHAH